jgi:universal stress protein E
MKSEKALFNKIFVVLEPQQEEQIAFDRALFLARATGASLHLFICAYDIAIGIASFLSGSQKTDIVRTIVDGNQAMLDRLAERLEKEGIEVTSEVVWHRHAAECIIEALGESGCDLLMKKAKLHSRVKEVIFSHLDWNILRFSPCPVLLVKNGQWDDVGQVLAAVNAAPEDDVHESLNQLILDTSRQLADELQFQLHLVSAYPAPPVYIPIGSDGKNPVNYRKKMKRMVADNVGNFATDYKVEDQHVHLVEGPVDWVIPTVSRDIVAEFVVMGTVSRQRMGTMALGNTAEHILDELNCDVLVVKSSLQIEDKAKESEAYEI